MIFSKRLWHDTSVTFPISRAASTQPFVKPLFANKYNCTFSANKHKPAFIHSSYTIPRHFHFINYDLLVYDSLKNAPRGSSSPNRTRHIFLSFIFPIQPRASWAYISRPHPLSICQPAAPVPSGHIPVAPKIPDKWTRSHHIPDRTRPEPKPRQSPPRESPSEARQAFHPLTAGF